MPTVVLRLTRHPAGPEQHTALHRIFGDLRVVEVSETVPDVARITALLAEHHADVLEAVLPLELLAQCLDPRAGVGVPVIRAVMQRTLTETGDAIFTFSHYERLISVRVIAERL